MYLIQKLFIVHLVFRTAALLQLVQMCLSPPEILLKINITVCGYYQGKSFSRSIPDNSIVKGSCLILKAMLHEISYRTWCRINLCHENDGTHSGFDV